MDTLDKIIYRISYAFGCIYEYFRNFCKNLADLRITKKKKKRIIVHFLVLFAAVLTIQIGLMAFQKSRYYYGGPDDPDNLACTELSRECEAFFEGVLGVTTYQVTGHDSLYDGTTGISRYENGHQWIILDFGNGFRFPFESTLLLPFFNPLLSHDYERLRISSGYFIGDYEVEESLDWNEWDGK